MTLPLDWLKQQNKQSGANLDESIDDYEQLADQADQALKQGQAKAWEDRQCSEDDEDGEEYFI